ncbi:hypothetical protein [uncultured Cohaesibacter sp.]|uniref:hypothetical protein n=1 Tax=uncultured Cohaesibacter sp. TaxID=1002546 RepID=UPI00292D0786|nr:hypothetical protein [uncultured Cohaesibacter sp.]
MINPRRNFKIGSYVIKIPDRPFTRKILGVALVIGGILGFLPILGFWMIPLGLIILSIDLPLLRKYRRKLEIRSEKKRRSKLDHQPAQN